MVKKTKPSHVEVAQQALDYIHENLAGDLRTETIAQHLHYERHYLNKIFSLVTGESINRMTIKLRVEAAQILLRDTNIPVYRIVLLVGYHASAGFNLVFKR